MDTADFVQSSDSSVLLMKYLVLSSVREAFHYSLEQFIMGEMECGPADEFRVRSQVFNPDLERYRGDSKRVVLRWGGEPME
jgi:hypothetical protein